MNNVDLKRKDISNNKILVNKIQCKKCKDIIEFKHVHDFKWCACKSIAVDGGLEYLRRVGNDIVEKYMTLAISKIMYDEFKRLGIPVYMTREEDMTLSPKDRVAKAMNYFGKDKNVILISNHINAG